MAHQAARGHDQVGLHLAQRLVVEAQPDHGLGRERLQGHVGPAHEVERGPAGLGLGQVEGQAQLARVDVAELQGPLGVGLVVLEVARRAQRVEVVDRLHPHDGGAQVGQGAAGLGPGEHPHEVGDLEPLERPGGRCAARRRTAAPSGARPPRGGAEARPAPTPCGHPAGRRRAAGGAGVAENLAKAPGKRIVRVDPSPTGTSTSSQKPRSARCWLWTSSSVVVTGAISTRRLKVAANSSALVLVARKSPSTPLTRSYSAIGSRPVVEHDAVVDPVLVPGGLVAEALLVDPLHQAAGEGAHGGAEQERDRDLAVPAGPQQLDLGVEPGQADPAGHPAGPARVAGVGEQERLAGHAVALLGGQVDVLAPARAVVPLVQRDQGGAGRVGGGVMEGLGHADPQRRAVLVAGERHGPRRGGQHQVAVGPARLGAVGAEGGDREVHERRVGRLEHVPAQAEGVQLARDRTTRRARRRRPSGRAGPRRSSARSRSSHDRALAPVVGPVEEAPVGALDVVRGRARPVGCGCLRAVRPGSRRRPGRPGSGRTAGHVRRSGPAPGRTTARVPPSPSGRMPAGDAGHPRRCRTARACPLPGRTGTGARLARRWRRWAPASGGRPAARLSRCCPCA